VIQKESNIQLRGGSHTMNKADLVGAVADASGITKADAAKAVEATFDSITSALKKGSEVRLVGFGTFAVAKRKASTGRNPRTGEPMTIKASNQPKFKAGKALKDAVN
jgi:DNA-binding protein HU-beta